MLNPIQMGMIMNASILILLCVGFSFTHMIEKFPNFAHTSFATIGIMCTYTMVRLWGFNPYFAWPIAVLLNGFVGVAIYLLVVRPIRNSGSGNIRLTFALFSLTFILRSVLSIYSYWVMRTQGFRAIGFMLREHDFTLLGLPGIVFMAPLTCLILVASLHLFLTKTRFGIAIKATSENLDLASVLGINVQQIHLASWFITGALAGLAGAAIPLWEFTNLGYSDKLMVDVMAGSVLGGLDNIYGAIFGGIALVIIQTVLPGLLLRPFGLGILKYRPLIPILVIIVILMFEPKGITNIITKGYQALKRINGFSRADLKEGV
jgi:branched-chain amino acid transport system permease protein